jgi:hypothetical protein
MEWCLSSAGDVPAGRELTLPTTKPCLA